MRAIPALALCALVLAGSLSRAQSVPKLAVVLVVDQMRGDYLEVFRRHWQRGFRTLTSEGFVFDNAAYPYFYTDTCAGHATISTGTFPRTHGMVSDAWWHRAERLSPECTTDEGTEAVTYGRPVRPGRSPKRLLVPTLADGLRAQKPGARVVSVSLKPRSAIGLAGTAGDAVVWFEPGAASFVTSRAYAPAPVPEVARFVAADSFEKDLGRTWNLLGLADSYIRRDAGVGEQPPAGWTGLFPHRLVFSGRGAGAAAAQPAAPAAPAPQLVTMWQATPFADEYLARMASSLLDSFALGRREATDFLGVGFSALDFTGHAFGPDSREVEDVLRHLDVTLGRLIEVLDARVGRANYVLALSADHGVAPFAGFGRGGRLHSDDIRDRVEETLIAHFGPRTSGTYVDAVGSGYVYLAPGVFDRLAADDAAMAAVERALMALPGIAKVLRADQLTIGSQDRVERAVALGHVSGRSGDIAVVSQEYWIRSGRAGVTASHGSPHRYDTHVPVVLFGGPVKAGRSGTAVTPADIAPTLAQIIGVRLDGAEGRVLKEALR